MDVISVSLKNATNRGYIDGKMRSIPNSWNMVPIADSMPAQKLQAIPDSSFCRVFQNEWELTRAC